MRWSVEKANSWVRERDSGMGGGAALLLDKVGPAPVVTSGQKGTWSGR